LAYCVGFSLSTANGKVVLGVYELRLTVYITQTLI